MNHMLLSVHSSSLWFLHTGFKAPYKTYDFESLKGFWSYPWRQDLPGHTNLVPGPWGLCANFSGQVVEQHITGITTQTENLKVNVSEDHN